MKKVTIFILAIFLLTACGDPKAIQGKTYDTYGLLNESNKKNPNIEYELILGNIIWSIILCETIVAPIYFIGFSLYEPIGPAKTQNTEKGVLK